MKASALLFRFRMIVMATIILLGFFAPWIDLWGVGRHITLLEWLALELSRAGLLSFRMATPVLIVCASLMAAVGAWLRIWGSAWLGHGIVINARMQAAALNATPTKRSKVTRRRMATLRSCIPDSVNPPAG